MYPLLPLREKIKLKYHIVWCRLVHWYKGRNLYTYDLHYNLRCRRCGVEASNVPWRWRKY